MSLQSDIFKNVIELFSSEQEEIRAAAAFAAGIRVTYRLLQLSLLGC